MGKNPAGSISHRSTLLGEFVEVEVPYAVLEVEEAEELARFILRVAMLARERRIEPTTAKLPLEERFALEVAP